MKTDVMDKLLHGTLIKTNPHETGKGDTYYAKACGFMHLGLASQTSEDKWKLLFRNNLILSRQSTTFLRIFSVSSKSVFVSGNTKTSKDK